MIELQNVSLRFPHNDNYLLKNITLSLPKGSITGLTGPSGCGKTLLGLTAAGIIPSLIPADLKGTVKRAFSKEPYKTNAAIVFQDPSFQLFAPTVNEELLFTPQNLGWDIKIVEDNYKQIISGLELKNLLSYDPRELSMGEIQRVAIGTALIQNPHILILDEPTQYIDPVHLRPVLLFITEWVKQHSITVLLIEHNTQLLRQVCSKLYFMDSGTIADNAAIKDSFPSASSVKTNERESFIRLSNVCYRYRHGKNVLNNITLNLRRNESVALLGPNGGGKTTLAKVLCGLYKPQSGTVTLTGEHPSGSNQKFKYISYVMQNPDCQIFAPTVKEECAFGPKNFGISESEYIPKISQYLRAFNMADFEERDPFSLSYGEKRRVNITSILAYDPEVIILDEPTCALDYANLKILLKQLKTLQDAGKTLIIITHNIQFARAIAHRALFINDGEIIGDAPLNEIREEDVSAYYSKK